MVANGGNKQFPTQREEERDEALLVDDENVWWNF